MLSKEKIARAKERVSKSLNDVWFTALYSQEENEEDERILLAYIKQLEMKLENVFWEGYIQKQKEAVEICKICKYKNKVEQLETNNKKLIDKLEEDKKKWQEFHNRVPEVPEYIDYILPFAKGEKE